MFGKSIGNLELCLHLQELMQTWNDVGKWCHGLVNVGSRCCPNTSSTWKSDGCHLVIDTNLAIFVIVGIVSSAFTIFLAILALCLCICLAEDITVLTLQHNVSWNVQMQFLSSYSLIHYPFCMEYASFKLVSLLIFWFQY